MNAITCADLSFSYGKVRVIDDVSFEVQKGESIGVIGPNGGGKSTLLKLMFKGLNSTFFVAPKRLLVTLHPLSLRSNSCHCMRTSRFSAM